MKQSRSKLAALCLLCPQATASILVWLPDRVRVPVWHDRCLGGRGLLGADLPVRRSAGMQGYP